MGLTRTRPELILAFATAITSSISMLLLLAMAVPTAQPICTRRCRYSPCRHLRRATPRTKAAIAAEVYCHAWRRLSRPAPTSWPLRRGSAMLACVSPVVGSGAAQRLWVKEVRGETAQGVQYHEVYNGLCRPSLRRRRLRHRRRSRCAPPLLPLAISRTGLLAQCSRPCRQLSCGGSQTLARERSDGWKMHWRMHSCGAAPWRALFENCAHCCRVLTS